jgi:hypothetical protein
MEVVAVASTTAVVSHNALVETSMNPLSPQGEITEEALPAPAWKARRAVYPASQLRGLTEMLPRAWT